MMTNTHKRRHSFQYNIACDFCLVKFWFHIKFLSLFRYLRVLTWLSENFMYVSCVCLTCQVWTFFFAKQEKISLYYYYHAQCCLSLQCRWKMRKKNPFLSSLLSNFFKERKFLSYFFFIISTIYIEFLEFKFINNNQHQRHVFFFCVSLLLFLFPFKFFVITLFSGLC